MLAPDSPTPYWEVPARKELDSPKVISILTVLNRAGVAGVTAPDVARHFTHPESLQRRNAIVNDCLHRLAARGKVKRGAVEASAHYHNVLVYRWYITSAGKAYLAAGGMAGTAATRRENRAKLAAMKAEKTSSQQAIREQALREASALGPLFKKACAWQRYQIVKALRARYLTLQEIASSVGMTRERIRQISTNTGVRRCKCHRDIDGWDAMIPTRW